MRFFIFLQLTQLIAGIHTSAQYLLKLQLEAQPSPHILALERGLKFSSSVECRILK